MQLVDYLDKGARANPQAPCLTLGDTTQSYAEVQRHSHRLAYVLAGLGLGSGDVIGILSANNDTAFACVFGISRLGGIWCPINPRNEVNENAAVLHSSDCKALIYQAIFAPMVSALRPLLPKDTIFICLDDRVDDGLSLDSLMQEAPQDTYRADAPGDIVIMPGTGGTTGQPKTVQLSAGNVETMTALTLMGYPIGPRPVFLALAPLTHAAGILCFPILAMGGEIVVLPAPDLKAFLAAIPAHQVTHTFLPPTVIYMLLDHPDLDATDLSSLQCFWYGAAPISKERLREALDRIGPMAQLFGQTEAPMMISMMSPADHRMPDGSVHEGRLRSAGRIAPLVDLTIQDAEGQHLPVGEHGEICVKGSLVMPGYYKNPKADADAFRGGWLRTGDIGYVDAEGFLYIVDRAKDMIITGGFNVYSVEVENALRSHPSVQDCAVVGLPDDKWGERIVAVVIPRAGASLDPAALMAHVKADIGSVKTPKDIVVWEDLPRSKVGKVLKPEIKARLREKAMA